MEDLKMYDFIKYDYHKNMVEDILDYIRENRNALDFTDRDALENTLHDDLWIEDSVTGNGSGSYWFSRHEAEEALLHNLDLLAEAVEEFGGGVDVLKSGAEACDVTIRCYLLGECIAAALDIIESEN
jgi:hypothetical protein